MLMRCPERGGDLTELDPGAEMGSRPSRYDCHEYALQFGVDAAGLLVEVE